MQALFVVLNNPGLLDELFSAFINIGITRATCIESVGMGRSISEMDMTSVPIFSFLRHHLNESRPFNNTVFTLIADDQVDAAMAGRGRGGGRPLHAWHRPCLHYTGGQGHGVSKVGTVRLRCLSHHSNWRIT